MRAFPSSVSGVNDTVPKPFIKNNNSKHTAFSFFLLDVDVTSKFTGVFSSMIAAKL